MKDEQGLPDGHPQPGAQPDFAHTTIDRAVERLYRTVGPKMLSKTPCSLDHIVHDQPQPDSPEGLGAFSLRFGRRVGSTRLRLIFNLCLASLLIAALTGTGIFLLTQTSKNKLHAESAPAEEMPEQAREGTRSITAPAVRPSAIDMLQTATLERLAPIASSAQAAPEQEANSAVSSPSSVAASTEVVSALTAPSDKSELNTVAAPAVPTAGPSSTTPAPPPPRPPSEHGFSATEIAALMARGDASLATGDVASARLFYERAADSGEARAAARLGETFDPLFLGQGRLRGVSGDLDRALFWYRRARDLGATEVERRLTTLETKRGG
jgi:hypothetical protein